MSGWLIRLFTFSQWNHVAIQVGGVVFDATGRYGVRTWSAHDFKSHYDRVESIGVEIDEQATTAFLKSQLGKPYDFMALVAMPFRSDWQSRDKWFCSELVTAALKAGGCKFDRLPAHRVTPRDLWVRA
jgi:uncharacterized protein YycO